MNPKFLGVLFSTTLAGAVLVSLVDAAAKSFVLLGLAIVVCLALRRASAATRHVIWLSTLAATLALPVLSLCLPRWRVLPAWTDLVRGASTTVTSGGAVEVVPASPVHSPTDPLPPTEVAMGAILESFNTTAADTPTVRIRAGELPKTTKATTIVDVLSVLPTALLIVWGIGVVLLLLSMVRSAWMLHRLAASLGVVTNGPVAAATGAIARELGLPTPVLFFGSAGIMPMVWGIRRGRLHLPADATDWDATRLRAVLLHELAHLRRHDPLTQAIAQVARALHWFNPLAWLALRNLRVEQERACDDYVLRGGVKPSDYAGHVLELATQLQPAPRAVSVALAMADRTRIEGRLQTILDAARNRCALSRWFVVFTVLLTGSAAFSLAMLHAADEKSGAPVPRAPQTPKDGARLRPGSEKKLEWGEPVNGLRMALAWPPTLGEPAAGDVPDLFLAVQNVSAVPVRLCTTAEASTQRRLSFATDGVLQGRIVSSEPNGVDVTLAPREVVFLRLFTEGAAETERAPHGSMLASTVRQSPKFTLRADIEIAKAPAGAWMGKLVTPDTRAGIGAEAPKNRKAQALFKVWLRHARVNGNIPGGCIARLGDRVKEFVRGNLADKAGEPYAKRMEPLVSRLDGARDWQPAEASALLTDIAAVSEAPLSVMMEEMAGGTILYGPPLPKELENAPWGEALPNGLRVACVLEPRAATHRLGAPLKMRILVHNAGTKPVVFRARTWHHIEPTARDAKGAEIEMESVTRFTRPPLVAHRLEPGGFVELASPGIGIGKYGFHDFKNADIASWISAKDGDEVTLTPGPVPLCDWNEASVLNGTPRWWLDFFTARLSLATPLPADAAERSQLLQSTVRDIFYADATAEEIAAFIADRESGALESLAKRLAGRADLTPFSGSLQSGPTKFRVTAADPGAAKPTAAPAAASAPADKRDSPASTPAANNANGDLRSNPAAAGEPRPAQDVGQPPAQPKQQTYKSDQERMVGNWFIMNEDSLRQGEMWVITEASILMHAKNLGRNSHHYAHRLDASKNPKQIDITVTKVNGSRVGIIKGIYVLDGDELRLCLGALDKDRPAVFPQKPGPGEVLIVQRNPLGTWPLKAKEAQPAKTEKRDSPPSDKHVQELFGIWQASARSDGRIPGGLIGQLQAEVEESIRINRNDNADSPYVKKLEPIVPRFDVSHDWPPAEALALLNDLAVLSHIPIENTLWADGQRRVYPGQRLPPELKDAPWGEPTAEGLRVARPLDPQAKSYPVGMALRSRVLLHNDGQEPVLVRTESFMQPGYEARDAKGNPVDVTSTYWTTLAAVQTWRLAPGEFVEITTPGFGVGKGAGKDDWANVRVGSWIDVADGTDVTLSPGRVDVEVHMFRGDIPASRPANGLQLKLKIIREHLKREGPLPALAADRELIVRRVTKDIFGNDPTADEIAAFVADKSDDPFTALSNRLLHRPGLAAFVGQVKPGEITFRTTPLDPNAANRPKVAIGPGRYTLDDHVRLIIVGKAVDGRRTSDAELRFWGEKATDDPPGPPYRIAVPDGFGTWAITCRPGTGILWVLTHGALRKIDYSNPAAVTETSIARGSGDDMPHEFRETVKRILSISNVPAAQIEVLINGSSPDE